MWIVHNLTVYLVGKPKFIFKIKRGIIYRTYNMEVVSGKNNR